MLTASEGSASIEVAGDSAGGGRRGRSAFRRYALAPLLSLAAAAAVLVSLLVANGSANASAVTQSWGLKIDANSNGGAAASGTVTFTGPNSFRVDGQFRMICGPTSAGQAARVHVTATFVNGTTYGTDVAYDAICGPEIHGMGYSGSFVKKVASVHVNITEAWRMDITADKDNPYT